MADKVSDLLAEIKEQQKSSTRTRCTMGSVMAQLDPADRDAITMALADNAIFGSTIAKVLKARGHDIGSLAVNRHRRKACACSE